MQLTVDKCVLPCYNVPTLIKRGEFKNVNETYVDARTGKKA